MHFCRRRSTRRKRRHIYVHLSGSSRSLSQPCCTCSSFRHQLHSCLMMKLHSLYVFTSFSRGLHNPAQFSFLAHAHTIEPYHTRSTLPSPYILHITLYKYCIQRYEWHVRPASIHCLKIWMKIRSLEATEGDSSFQM